VIRRRAAGAETAPADPPYGTATPPRPPRAATFPRRSPSNSMPIQSAHVRSAAAAFAIAVGATAAAAQQPEQHLLRGDDVAVFSIAGETRVEPGTGSDVVVEVRRGGRDGERLRIATGPIGRQQTLRVIAPGDRLVYPRLGRGSRTQLRVDEDGTFGRGRDGARRVTIAGSGAGTEAYADLRILVPAGRRIAIHQGSGRVDVANVAGEIQVRSSAAGVEITGTSGSLSVKVGSGGVRIRDAVGDAEVETGAGGVAMTGLRGGRLRVETGSGAVRGSGIEFGQVDVDVGAGSVRLDDLRARQGVIDTGSGSVRLGLAAAMHSLRVDTGSGAVVVELPPSAGASLDVRTGSGGIGVDLPLGDARRARNSLSGTIGDGAGQIRIRTGSGSVRIREH
jgi:DUF4097 and DUF4098 domain-containing protein YvlB